MATPLNRIPYLHSNTQFSESVQAVIVLPEIFGLNHQIKETVDHFAADFQVLAFGLDFFYQLTQEPNDLDYISQTNKAIDLMSQMTGEQFLSIFNHSLQLILDEYEYIEEFIVCGFCFGGKLAYLSGVNPKVNKIISFYGTNSNVQNFYHEKSVIEALVETRKNDSNLSVTSIFGESDLSISEFDRLETKEALTKNGIEYTQKVFKANHAFFNSERENYNKIASELAWEEIREIVNA